MSSALIDVHEPAHSGRLDVLTVTSDRIRASLRALGCLDSSNATLLADVISGHLRARRRFLRLNVAGLTVGDLDALNVIVDAHLRLLSSRGTLILTGVLPEFMGTLARAGVDRELFTVQPLACELTEPMTEGLAQPTTEG